MKPTDPRVGDVITFRDPADIALVVILAILPLHARAAAGSGCRRAACTCSCGLFD